jgi:hypothetical protein
MTQLQLDQSLLRLSGSSEDCLSALLCVPVVVATLTKDPAHYAQKTRNGIEAVYR